MPHKKNPDFLELVRGNTGRIYGNLMSVLTTMKSLPLTYNRDMQLDKEPLFSSVETLRDELKVMAKFIKKIRLNKSLLRPIDLIWYFYLEHRMPEYVNRPNVTMEVYNE